MSAIIVDHRQDLSSVADIAEKLGRIGDHLKARGIRGLWLFGSTARGEARGESDVDLLAEFDPAATVTLVTLASLTAEMSDVLGRPTDLVERHTLRPAIRETAERDAIRVL